MLDPLPKPTPPSFAKHLLRKVSTFCMSAPVAKLCFARYLVAINLAKLSKASIKLLGMGSGSALPGRIALALNPKILDSFTDSLEQTQLQSVVTGTNGKTTTSGILKEIYKVAAKQDPISNEMGANLYYGVVAEFVNSASLSGKLKSDNYVLEIDEAALQDLAKSLSPRSIVVTNLFRDQLDRFGEIDATQKLIIQGIINGSKFEARSSKRTLVLNADDSKVWDIQNHVTDYAIFGFSVESDQQITNLDSEARAKEDVDLKCQVLETSLGQSKIKLSHQEQSIELDLVLPGLYNVYNATAAAAAALVAEIDLETIKQGIANYHGNFGRAEKKQINGIDYQCFLIKNPTGATEVLKDLSQDSSAKYMIAINDNYADGRDVSWLWDAQFELLKTQSTVICSGIRAEDMALRLKYAGLDTKQIQIEKDLNKALELATEQKDNRENLYVLPTYTALLELNKI